MPKHREDDPGRDPRDEGDQQRAADVAADGRVDPVADPPPALLRLGRELVEEPLDPLRPLEQHEHDEDEDRDGADDDGDDAARDTDGRARIADDPAGAALRDRLPHALDDVVVRLEEADRPAALRQVLDVVGHGIREVADLVDEDRHEGGADRGEQADDAEHRDRDRHAAPTDAAGLQPLDERVEGEREENRDHDPRQHLAGLPEEAQDDERGDDDPEDDEHGPRLEPDDPLLDHGVTVTGRSDGARRAGA